VAKADGRRDDPDDDGALLALFDAITSRRSLDIARQLDSSRDLARRPICIGASRHGPDGYFLVAIRHYVYAGDTALHIAAASYSIDIARELLRGGADVNARNRRGAQPIHYASVGRPGAESWDPRAQAAVIAYLLRAGADPNATDKSGVTPLHRAIRTRSAAAVRVLLQHGADPRRKNGSGSTPLRLAVHNTGRSGSGSAAAHEQQRMIIQLLADHGANDER